MIAAIASGKGGTGKTTVTASLASVWPDVFSRPVVAVDLDVEEPNLHLFLKPEIEETRTARFEVPMADESKCDYCRRCAELCQFKAINVLGDNLLIFPEMCHSCGGCLLVCPLDVLSPDFRELGEISWGQAETSGFVNGRLRVGEAMSPPLMRQVKAKVKELYPEGKEDMLIDAPPGVSCPAMNAVKDSEVIVLVTEPTPFGFHDLKLAWESFASLDLPMGVVVNRAGQEYEELSAFCEANSLPILAQVPYDRKAAEMYAKGHILADISLEFRRIFLELARNLEELRLSGKGPDHE